jgi:hypothetical protein
MCRTVSLRSSAGRAISRQTPLRRRSRRKTSDHCPVLKIDGSHQKAGRRSGISSRVEARLVTASRSFGCVWILDGRCTVIGFVRHPHTVVLHPTCGCSSFEPRESRADGLRLSPDTALTRTQCMAQTYSWLLARHRPASTDTSAALARLYSPSTSNGCSVTRALLPNDLNQRFQRAARCPLSHHRPSSGMPGRAGNNGSAGVVHTEEH